VETENKEAPIFGGFFSRVRLYLYSCNVDSLWAFFTLFDGELHLLAFLKALEALALDRSVVDKNIIAFFAFDETIAFAIIEPLDRSLNSLGHDLLPPYGGY
jgi:ABC-type long-subunit fatty acid transport system fused permease/ATPase subunit